MITILLKKLLLSKLRGFMFNKIKSWLLGMLAEKAVDGALKLLRHFAAKSETVLDDNIVDDLELRREEMIEEFKNIV